MWEELGGNSRRVYCYWSSLKWKVVIVFSISWTPSSNCASTTRTRSSSSSSTTPCSSSSKKSTSERASSGSSSISASTCSRPSILLKRSVLLFFFTTLYFTPLPCIIRSFKEKSLGSFLRLQTMALVDLSFSYFLRRKKGGVPSGRVSR